MIRKQAVGVSPDIELTIDNTPIDYNLMGIIELYLSENKHDMAVVRLAGMQPRLITSIRNKGISIRLSTGPLYSQEFYGHVVEVKPKSVSSAGLVNDSLIQEADLICMGVSYSMRSVRDREWADRSLTDVALDFADYYQFSLDCPTTPYLLRDLAQVQESDWQFLVRYSELLGLRVNCHGTHLHVYDPAKALSRRTSLHKVYNLNRTKGSENPAPGQIIEFSGSFSQNHPDGTYKETLVTVMQDDGIMYDVSSRELTPNLTVEPEYENRLNKYVVNYEQAIQAIRSHLKKAYDYTANVRVLGLLGCVPGGVVELDNYNADFDGYWYVQSVKHTIHSSAFTTELELAQNIENKLQVTNTPQYRDHPAPRYNGKTWVRSRRIVNEYS